MSKVNKLDLHHIKRAFEFKKNKCIMIKIQFLSLLFVDLHHSASDLGTETLRVNEGLGGWTQETHECQTLAGRSMV